ncbi:MAG: sigma-70 family RNA polymerase sigma factor [Dehalococcoidales bacterium]|nr:sigma-70 family RNA polymerase sigma factor [Dehalococcoidales bacterium]
MQDEESLVRRAKEHDPEALTKIYEENFDKVYRYVVLKIGERTEAEDITQQVFLSAIKSFSSFKWQGAPVSAWLYRIAHNQIVDYLRRKTKVPMVQLDESLASEGDDPGALAEQKIEIEQLGTVMKRLTKSQQQVISLRFTAEMSIAECARAMGKSEGAIKALQHSAIQALRRELAVG